jgi:hypothetical protein
MKIVLQLCVYSVMPLFGFTDLMFWGRAILPTSNAIVFMTHYTQLITQPLLMPEIR